MENRAYKSSQAQSEPQNSLTIEMFEQLLGHYKKQVWEIKIAPTLTSNERLSNLIAVKP